MPFIIPTISTLQQQALADIATADLPGAQGGLLRNSILRVLAYVQAGFSWLHYGYLDYIAQQAVPYTATDTALEAWGAFKGLVRNVAATATGTVTFTGTNTTPIPDGTTLIRTDGAQFVTTALGTISSGTATVAVSASLAGSAGNTITGTVLNLGQSIAGVNATATVAADIGGGADNETDDSLRTRILLAFAQVPNGGSISDFTSWILSVPGVTRAWVASFGPGNVTGYFMEDEAEAAFNGFPQGTNGVGTFETRGSPTATGDQLAVSNFVYPLRPVTSIFYAYAPVAQPINITVANLSPNTSAIQAGITTAITAQFVNLGSPLGSEIYPSDIYDAIASVTGIQRFTLSSPSAPVAITVGNLPTLGTTSFSGP